MKSLPPVILDCRRFASAHPACRGFTLMEMILVLAVLVGVAALALPALQGPMEDHRLRKAGDLVRAELAKARLTAMQTGRIHVFTCQIGTGLYSVQPWLGDGDYLEASADEATQITPRQLQPRDELNPLGISGMLLPPGVTFFSGSTQTDSRGLQVEPAMAGGLGSALGGEQSIVFYPDGSSSDANLVLTNERFFVEVSLRGLTGLTRGSDLLTADELTP